MSSLLDLSGLAALAVALLWIGRTIRQDAHLTRRWQEIARELRDANTELAGRVNRLERAYNRERRRRVQLEDVMRRAGLELPPWPADNDDPTNAAELPPGGHLIQFRRTRA
jgi:hypothetical protein